MAAYDTSNIPDCIHDKIVYLITESSVDLSNFEVLFETIITALKPVVYTEVDRALTSSKYANKIDPNTLAQKIILEISPYVREALQKEVKRIQDNTLTEDQVVQLVITDLKPTIIRVVQGSIHLYIFFCEINSRIKFS